MTSKPSAVEKAEEYYDSDAANTFYYRVWGGEDIHIGLYKDKQEDIAAASRRTVSSMAGHLRGLSPDARVIDLGAGYGGSARYLAKTHGCHITCLNLSEAQNEINRTKNEEEGLSSLIDVVYGSFENVPLPDQAYDIVWSQDAILHSGQRHKVVQEVARLLKPGGEFIFTDPMQADDCPNGVLQPILDRIHLDSLGSIAFYREALAAAGFDEVDVVPMLGNLSTHYDRVGQELQARYEEISGLAGMEYVDNMIRGLRHWVDGAESGYLAWGILHFQKK